MTNARKVVVGGSFFLTIVSALAVALMINWLSFRHYRRLDWTHSRVYSISEQTRQILAKLDQPLRMIVFLPAEGQQRSPVFDEVRELADRYAAASPRIHVEYVDPFRNRMRAQEVAQKYGLQRASTVVFEYGEGEAVRKHFVDESRLAEYDYSHLAFGERPKVEAFKGEEAFTAAVKGLIDRKLRVVFTSGHGEASFKGSADQDFATAAEALRRENYEVEEWTGLAAETVPEGTDVLIVGGPKKAFLPNEVEAVRRYLSGGGKVLFLLEPVFGSDRKLLVATGLEPVLSEWGVKLGQDIVVDPSSALPLFGADTLYTNRFRNHPLTRGLEAFPMILPLARSVAGAGNPPEGYSADVLLETSREGWGETDLAGLPQVKKEESDTQGPVPLIVAVGHKLKSVEERIEEKLPAPGKGAEAASRPRPEARLVVVGDSEFAANVLFERNSPHFLASINWLAVREESLGIPPKKTGKVALHLTPEQLFRVDLLIFLVLPGLAIAAGLGVWWRRRN